MKHTRRKKGGVRSHHALLASRTVKCNHCGQEKLSHIMCQNCGYYAGRKVVDVLARLDKKERKKKEKELHQHEEETAREGKTLSAEELSHK